jgi:hypothetical protein
MLSRNSFIAPSCILTLGLITISGVAGATVHRGAHRNTPGVHSHAAPQPWYHTRRDVARRTGYGAPVPSTAYRSPGYVFVPGRGILGEDCDMPTSTCRDEPRDGNKFRGTEPTITLLFRAKASCESRRRQKTRYFLSKSLLLSKSA